MRNLLNGLVLGVVGGIIIGWLLAERQRQGADEAERTAYASDPELRAIRQEIARERQTDRWLNALEDDDA
jgi:hypothetical protein